MLSGCNDFNDLQPISANGTSLCYPCVTHDTSPPTCPVTAFSLTDRHIRTLNPTGHRVDHFDSNVTGLALRHAASGRKTWCVFFRVNRRLRRMTLGHYPAVTLHAARTKARQVLAEVALHGTDPAAHRLDTRHGATVSQTWPTSISGATPSPTRRAGRKTNGSSPANSFRTGATGSSPT